MSVCLSVRRQPYLSESSQSDITIILDTVTVVSVSVMRMHRVLIVMTLTFIQGHTELNHENKKCSIYFSETVQASLL